MKLSPTKMMAMKIGLNRVYLLTRVDRCEDDPVTHHYVGHDIRVKLCLYLLTRVDRCEDDPVTHHHIGHDIRVKLCIPADPR
jgi:hypothetical protein